MSDISTDMRGRPLLICTRLSPPRYTKVSAGIAEHLTLATGTLARKPYTGSLK